MSDGRQAISCGSEWDGEVYDKGTYSMGVKCGEWTQTRLGGGRGGKRP
jgi:hypothetical protein